MKSQRTDQVKGNKESGGVGLFPSRCGNLEWLSMGFVRLEVKVS